MEKESLDFLCLQETHTVGNVEMRMGNYVLFNGSSVAGGRESHGVGILMHKRFRPLIRYMYSGHSRSIAVCLDYKPLPLLLLSAYAPTAVSPLEEKERFYSRIKYILQHTPQAIPIIAGDFNARVVSREDNANVFGPHFFPTPYPLADAPEDVLESRDLFAEFCTKWE